MAEPLGEDGQRLFDDYAARFELDPGELIVLEAACHTLDELRRLEDELDVTAIIQPGARGTKQVNPLLDQCRRHRQALASILSTLRIDGPAQSVSEAASVVALTRWRKVKR